MPLLLQPRVRRDRYPKLIEIAGLQVYICGRGDTTELFGKVQLVQHGQDKPILHLLPMRCSFIAVSVDHTTNLSFRRRCSHFMIYPFRLSIILSL